jgi:hypothetical protein
VPRFAYGAAVLNAQRGKSNRVLLTFLGGGAYGNEIPWIYLAIRRALKIVSAFDLDVSLVSYSRPSQALVQLAQDLDRTDR